MRDHISQIVDSALRSEDRTGDDRIQDTPSQLAAELIRLARLATSVHMVEAACLTAQGDPARDRTPSVRELVR